MRILVVGINYAPDLVGVAKYNAELCEGLASFGHEVRVITAPPYYPQWRIPDGYRAWRYSCENLNDVLINRVPIYVPKTPNGPRRLLHHASFAVASGGPILATALRWRPDVVCSVAPSLVSAALPAWIARKIRSSSWLHLHDFEIDAAFDLGILANKRLRALMTAIEKKILRSFDAVSTISPQMMERMIAKGVAQTKIYEIRNWTDTEQVGRENGLSSRNDLLGLDSSHFVCLYSGTMSHKQGLEVIIQAARLLNELEPSFRFVLCGEGPFKAALREMATNLYNVQFLGLQPEKSFTALLMSADVHVVPQRPEAADLVLPSKLGGILASGRPAVVMARSETGLAKEVNGGGLVVPPGDPEALAAALRSLAVNPALMRSLGQGARTIALQRWDKTTTLRKINHALQKLASKDANLGTSLVSGSLGIPLEPESSNDDVKQRRSATNFDYW